MLRAGRASLAARGPDQVERGDAPMTTPTATHDGVQAALRGGNQDRAAAATQREHAAQAARRLTQRIADEGLADVSYAAADSPFGTLLVAATRHGLVRLAFPEASVDGML